MIRRLITFFTDTLFRKRFKYEWMNRAARQYRLFFYTARGLQEHGTVIRCAALTFYTLISIVPILAVVFAVVKGFGLLDTIIDTLYGLFPQTPDIVDYMVEFADKALANTHSGVVAAVGVVMLFWAVIRVFGSIESAFNNIWEVTSSRSITSKYPVYITVVVAVPLLWAAVSGTAAYLREIFWLEPVLAAVLSRVVSLVLVWLTFTLLYRVIPNTSVSFGSAFTAGMVAGTAFMLFQWGYVYIQQMMTSYNAIYGSFAALPLFLLWVQYSWTILLFGGELSFAYQNIDKFDEERESLRIDYDSRRKIALAAMTVIVGRFMDGAGAVSISEVRRRLDLPTRIVNSVLSMLVEAGQLIELAPEKKGDEASFVPARDLSSFTVYGVLEALDDVGTNLRELDAEGVVMRIDAEWERLKSECRRSDNNRRIVELAREQRFMKK
ncbi:MAG: YihY family inner membrane protein [Alistipes sp.]|nr:YihY family inner membrane protein [Alistipes sp.]